MDVEQVLMELETKKHDLKEQVKKCRSVQKGPFPYLSSIRKKQISKNLDINFTKFKFKIRGSHNYLNFKFLHFKFYLKFYINVNFIEKILTSLYMS